MKNYLVAALLLLSFNVLGATHEVKLLTSGADGQTMVMSPGVLKIAAGDEVVFVPADPSHNVESMSIPQNAESFLSPMGKEFTYKFTENGVYLYKCTPHFIMGMIGVIQVGSPDNLKKVEKDWEAVSQSVAMNKERVTNYLKQVK